MKVRNYLLFIVILLVLLPSVFSFGETCYFKQDFETDTNLINALPGLNVYRNNTDLPPSTKDADNTNVLAVQGDGVDFKGFGMNFTRMGGIQLGEYVKCDGWFRTTSNAAGNVQSPIMFGYDLNDPGAYNYSFIAAHASGGQFRPNRTIQFNATTDWYNFSVIFDTQNNMSYYTLNDTTTGVSRLYISDEIPTWMSGMLFSATDQILWDDIRCYEITGITDTRIPNDCHWSYEPLDNQLYITSPQNRSVWNYMEKGNIDLTLLTEGLDNGEYCVLSRRNKTEEENIISRQTDGLVGWWAFEGNARDISGQGNDGTVNGGITNTSGVKGGAYDLDGKAGSMVGVKDFENSSQYTITTFINLKGWGSGGDSRNVIIANATTGFYWAFDSTNKQLQISSAGWKNSVETFNLDEWYMVGLRQNQTHTCFLIDGEIDNCYSGIYQLPANFHIGRRTDADGPPYSLNGSIDEVKIWNRTLSADEIRNEYERRALLPDFSDNTSTIENYAHPKFNASIFGNPTLTTGPFPGTTAMRFDGDGDWGEIYDNFSSGYTNMTVSFWMKFANNEDVGLGFRAIVGSYWDDSGLIYFDNNNNRIGFALSNESHTNLVYINWDDLTAQDWTHVTFVYGDSGYGGDVYFNGVYNASWSSGLIGPLYSRFNPWYIGGFANREWNGSIYNVQIDGVAWNASRVAQEYSTYWDYIKTVEIDNHTVGYSRQNDYVSYYMGSSCTMKDYGPFSNTLTNVAGKNLTNTSGIIGDGCYINGTRTNYQDYLTTAATDDYATKELAVAMWVNIKEDHSCAFWSYGKDANSRFSTRINGAGSIQLYDDIVNEGQSTTVGSYSTDEWFFVVTNIHSNGTKFLFKNGVYSGSDGDGNNFTQMSAGNKYFAINRETAFHYHCNASYDEIRIYNRTLTPTEARSFYERRALLPDFSDNTSTIENYAHPLFNGTINGNPTLTTGPFPGTTAMRFDGGGDYVDVGAVMNASEASSNGTIEMWLKRKITDIDHYYLYSDQVGGSDYAYIQKSTNTIVKPSNIAVFVDGVKTTTVPSDSWFHLVLVNVTTTGPSRLFSRETAVTNLFNGSVYHVRYDGTPWNASRVAQEYETNRAAQWQVEDTTAYYDKYPLLQPLAYLLECYGSYYASGEYIIYATNYTIINRSTLDMRNASFITQRYNWQTNMSFPIVSTTKTPTVNMTAVGEVDCSMSTDITNYTQMVSDDSGSDCVNKTITENKTMLSCSLPYSKRIDEGQDEMFIACKYNNGTLWGYNKSKALFGPLTTQYYQPPYYEGYSSNDNPVFPNIGDTLLFNVTVNTTYNISYCKVYINDTGSWVLNRTINVGSTSNVTLELNYTIQNVSIANNTNVSWRVGCNNSYGSWNYSNTNTITVRDTVDPIITINGNNFFDTTNRTIISSYLYNGTQNITIYDYNLFQAEENISCTTSGVIHYWNTIDWNSSVLRINQTVNLTGLSPQKCTVFIAVSDDHTKDEIQDYKVNKLNTGFNYITTEGNSIRITADELADDMDDVGTKKNKDRYNFNFKYKNNKNKRMFFVEADNTIYYRGDSKYPGHFVVWNDETKSGNWIDFEDVGGDINDYSIVKINDKKYKVTISTKDEKPIKEAKFSSVGGTNIVNISYDFWIGGAINVTTYNNYDGENFGDFNVSIFTLRGLPLVNETRHITPSTAFLGNLSNGSYRLTFFNDKFFNRTYIVNLSDGFSFSNVTFNSSQAQLNVIVYNVKTGVYLDDLNFTINNTESDYDTYRNETTVTYNTFNLNATLYNLYVNKEGYIPHGEDVNLTYRENKTLVIALGFYGSFWLYDEKTLDLFNFSSPNSIKFLLFCSNGTFSYDINNTNVTIPITCDYDKFKFVLDYGVDSYYRTFLFEYSDSLNASIYLIDLATTGYIYNTFILDDLLQDYDNPSIYILKNIESEQVQITADFIDIENKIGAYLIENDEYIVEVHSTNNPTRVIGSYSADLEGAKNLRLYETGVYPLEYDSYRNDVLFTTYTSNTTPIDMYVNAIYNDTSNQTTQVVWNIYETSVDTPPVFSTVVGSGVWTGQWNATAYRNSTLISTYNITYGGEEYVSSKIVNSFNVIVLELNSYLRTGFLDWFFTLFIGLIALMATITTANPVSLVVVGLASIFVIFKWYSLARGILGLALLISILSFLKQEDKL